MMKEKPVCPCCGKEVKRLMVPGMVIQQLVGLTAEEEPSDVTDLFLSLLKIMHADKPEDIGAEQLTDEEKKELERHMRRN